MKKLDRIPPKALALICDARKALLLRNVGTALAPEFETEDVLEAPENPPNREQQSDRPGRRLDRTAAGEGIGPRSSMEQADQHAIQEARFAAEVAEQLEKRHRRDPIDALVIAAPPAFLGALRPHIPDALRSVILAELPKDLTHLSVQDIARNIVGG